MPSNPSFESKPFLEEEHYDDSSIESDPPKRHNANPGMSLRNHYILYGLHLLLLSLNVAFFAWNNNHASISYIRDISLNIPGKTNTPAQSTLVYKTEEAAIDVGASPFVGEPRPEVDQAWSNLLRSSMIKLSPNEMRAMNKTSIALKDGSGYVGYIEAIHMLHCVKRMYQYQHPDHYPEFQGTEAFSSGHWDHCLEILRRGIMCNADVMVNTYTWKSSDQVKAQRTGLRKCTDWSRLQDWLEKRTVSFDSEEEFLAMLVPESDTESIGPI